MSGFETESNIVFGEIISADRLSGVVRMALGGGMTAEALYPVIAQGGLSPVVGQRFTALADVIAPNMHISPYAYMAVKKAIEEL